MTRRKMESRWCPLCGFRAHVGHSADKDGPFDYVACRHGCGHWRVWPDNRIARLSRDMTAAKMGARTHSCPRCSNPARTLTNFVKNGKRYHQIDCEKCGRWNRINDSEWYRPGEGCSQSSSYVPRRKLTPPRERPDKPGEKQFMFGHPSVNPFSMSRVRPALLYDSEGNVTSIRSAKAEVAPIYEGATLKGSRSVQTRWAIEERAEARRLAKEQEDWQ